MKFEVCYNFVSFLVLKIVIECPEEIFKKLLSVQVVGPLNAGEILKFYKSISKLILQFFIKTY